MGNSPTSPADIANRAAVLMGGFNSNTPMTGIPPNFDGTPTGIVAGAAYGGVVQTVGKQFGWDFARQQATLAASGGAPPWWYDFEYLYPTNGIEIRQVVSATAPADPNDPRPIRWTVGTTIIAGVNKKVIWTNLANALGVISGQPSEGTWDSLFTEEVIRLLASELAMGAAGRPETSQIEYERSGQIATVGRARRG